MSWPSVNAIGVVWLCSHAGATVPQDSHSMWLPCHPPAAWGVGIWASDLLIVSLRVVRRSGSMSRSRKMSSRAPPHTMYC